MVSVKDIISIKGDNKLSIQICVTIFRKYLGGIQSECQVIVAGLSINYITEVEANNY